MLYAGQKDPVAQRPFTTKTWRWGLKINTKTWRWGSEDAAPAADKEEAGKAPAEDIAASSVKDVVHQLHEQNAALRRRCHAYYVKDYQMKDLRKTVADLKKDNRQLRDENRTEIASKNKELKDARSERDKAQSNLKRRHE